jgi:hypothetical protein
MPGHKQLDRFKLLTAMAVLEVVPLEQIRSSSLANLDRWNAKGVWCSAHDEWRALMTSGTDEEVIASMTGLDDRANRLRQSPPYVGLLGREERVRLLAQVGLKPATPQAIERAETLIKEYDPR